MLIKLTPVVNFINILPTNFSYKQSFGSFVYVHVTREKQRSYKKFEEKRLTLNTGTSTSKKVTSNGCYPKSKNLKLEMDPPWGGGVSDDDDRGCYDPV